MAEAPYDLSFEDRRSLVQRAMSAIAGGRLAEASTLLAAAIRKARRARIADIEAEYLRMVTLYLAGDYNEAVNRAAACLEALHEIERDPAAWPAGLPVVEVRRVLERAMLQAMVRRGDGVVAIARHLWSETEGRTYPGKRGRPLPAAIREAWAATHQPFEFGIDTLREALKPFTAAVEARYAKMTDASAAAPAAQSRAAGPPQGVEREGGGEDSESEAADLLDKIVHREVWAVSEAEMERLLAACARSVRPDNVARIVRIFQAAPAKESRRILADLRKNRALAKAVADGQFEAAPPEVVRFLHMTFGAPTAA